MGSCSSSAEVVPSSVDEKKKPFQDDYLLNEKNLKLVKSHDHKHRNGVSNGHIPDKKQKEVRILENGEVCKNSSEKEEKNANNNQILKADLSMKEDARILRQKVLIDRQKTRFRMAKEMSDKVMEEKEMLSLTSRSRTTSRATSKVNINQGASTSQDDDGDTAVVASLDDLDSDR